MSPMDKVICDRCGELVFRRNLKLENLQKYDCSNKQAYIESVVNIDGVPFEVAESWASHGMFELCKEKARVCPECGYQFKTWEAKLCLSCGVTFESLQNTSS